MKKITLLLLLAVFVATGCGSVLKKDKDIVIEYQAMTRGSNQEVVLTHDMVQVRTIAGSKEAYTATITTQQWNDVVKDLEEIDLSTIGELKAPTNKRFYDGALIATLTVKTKDSTYRSSSFDHGEPPAEIASLVNRIVTLSTLDKGNE